MSDGPAIDSTEAAVYVIPTDAPEADGTLAWNKTAMVLVTVRAGDERGIGWSYAAAAAAVVTDVLADAVGGRSALDIPAAAEAMARAVRNIGRPGTAAMAISAVDIALWDLKSRLLGLPVTGLLGRALEHVPIYGSGGFTTYDEHQTREQLSGWVARTETITGSPGQAMDWIFGYVAPGDFEHRITRRSRRSAAGREVPAQARQPDGPDAGCRSG